MVFSFSVIVVQLFWLAFIGVSFYFLILLIRLARRGIVALDIYIRNNK